MAPLTVSLRNVREESAGGSMLRRSAGPESERECAGGGEDFAG